MPTPEGTRVRVDTARYQAVGVTSYELVPVGGTTLPAWTPGAHLDVHLPSGAVRQYSLCGDPGDRGRYRIGVLELPDGRGGSAEAHRELRPGVEVTVGEPRDEFALEDADRYVFVAGGIGVTPLLPMIRAVHARGAEWELVYGARSTAHAAFLADLATYGDRVTLVPQDTAGLPDVVSLAASCAGALVYACGPAPLLDALTDAVERAGRIDALRLERFSAPTLDPAAEGSFVVELARSGQQVTVPADETVLEAVRAAGVEVPSSCEMGICGTCETKVLAGQVDHRDDLLTEAERSAGGTMMVCVSRAASPRLVLDL